MPTSSLTTSYMSRRQFVWIRSPTLRFRRSVDERVCVADIHSVRSFSFTEMKSATCCPSTSTISSSAPFGTRNARPCPAGMSTSSITFTKRPLLSTRGGVRHIAVTGIPAEKDLGDVLARQQLLRRRRNLDRAAGHDVRPIRYGESGHRLLLDDQDGRAR